MGKTPAIYIPQIQGSRRSLTRTFHSHPNQRGNGAIVAQVCDLPYRRLAVGSVRSGRTASAGCKPAIRQTGGLRYAFGKPTDYETSRLIREDSIGVWVERATCPTALCTTRAQHGERSLCARLGGKLPPRTGESPVPLGPTASLRSSVGRWRDGARASARFDVRCSRRLDTPSLPTFCPSKRRERRAPLMSPLHRPELQPWMKISSVVALNLRATPGGIL